MSSSVMRVGVRQSDVRSVCDVVMVSFLVARHVVRSPAIRDVTAGDRHHENGSSSRGDSRNELMRLRDASRLLE